MGVVPTPVLAPAYGTQGRYLYFDEVRLPWVSEVTLSGRVYIAFDETAGPVTQGGPYLEIEEPTT